MNDNIYIDDHDYNHNYYIFHDDIYDCVNSCDVYDYSMYYGNSGDLSVYVL